MTHEEWIDITCGSDQVAISVGVHGNNLPRCQLYSDGYCLPGAKEINAIVISNAIHEYIDKGGGTTKVSCELVDTIVRHRVLPSGGVVVPAGVDTIVQKHDVARAIAYVGLKNGQESGIVVTWNTTRGNNSYSQSIGFVVI